MYSFTTSFFHPFITWSLKTHYIFIHCSILFFISQHMTHSLYHPSSHLLAIHSPLTTSSSILLSSHPSANHSLTTLSSILSSSDPSPNQLLTYYIFIHQQITHPNTSLSVLPSSHRSANHGYTFISLSIPPSSYPAANASHIHYMFIHLSILSFTSKLLNHYYIFKLSFYIQPSAGYSPTHYIFSTISPSLTTHYTFIYLSILSSISQRLTH